MYIELKRVPVSKTDPVDKSQMINLDHVCRITEEPDGLALIVFKDGYWMQTAETYAEVRRTMARFGMVIAP